MITRRFPAFFGLLSGTTLRVRPSVVIPATPAADHALKRYRRTMGLTLRSVEHSAPRSA